MAKWIVIRRNGGLFTEKVYPGIYLKLKQAKDDKVVQQWWTVVAKTPIEALNKIRQNHTYNFEYEGNEH